MTNIFNFIDDLFDVVRYLMVSVLLILLAMGALLIYFPILSIRIAIEHGVGVGETLMDFVERIVGMLNKCQRDKESK